MQTEERETALSVREFPRDLRLALKSEAATRGLALREYIIGILINRDRGSTN